MENPTTPFEGWALVEQMGHKSIAGYVCEVLVAGVPLLRVDVPGPEGQPPIATQFIHASTLYALTPMAEALVRKVAARTRVEPAATWGLSALPEGRGPDVDDDHDDEDDDPDKVVDELLVNHGLGGVLELLIHNYQDVAEPDSDRYVAILEHAKDLVDHDGAWPERLAPVAAPPTLVPGDELIPPPAPGAPVADDGIPF